MFLGLLFVANLKKLDQKEYFVQFLMQKVWIWIILSIFLAKETQIKQFNNVLLSLLVTIILYF